MYSLLLVLVVLMADSGKGGKRRRSPTPQPPALAVAEAKSDYVPDEESDDDDATDWENLPIEVLTRSKGKEPAEKEKGKEKEKEKVKEKGKKKATRKEKGKEKVIEKGKGKEKVTRGRGRKKSIGIEIREPNLDSSSSSDSPVHSFHDDPTIDSKRQSMYSSKLCVGECNVGVQTLIKFVPDLKALFENGDLLQVCNFSEQTGYGLELIREFYMRMGFLEETDGGPYSFKTSVRGVDITITPDKIASVLEMVAQTDSIDYLNLGFDAIQD